MKCLDLLSRMADIQKNIKELQKEDGFVSIYPDSLQISSDMFRELFPNSRPKHNDSLHGDLFEEMLAGIKITAFEVSPCED